jgi:DNA-binding MurR/RpiR family transcriptional regulator
MSLQIIDLSSLRERLSVPATLVSRTVASTPGVSALLDTDAVVAISVSGGKDEALLAARATAGATQSESKVSVQEALAF